MAPDSEGEFLVRVNGCPILCKGSNWVPLDAFHSRDAARYAQALELFAQAGCNIVRCWGGNVYEDHAFFDLCDRMGLLVWQDFCMACAIYPQSQDFAQMIEREAEHVIRKLRNHPCILLWAGDNEVDEMYDGLGYEGANRYNALTREVLPRAVRMNDPYRKFLPSSPYIAMGVPRYSVPERTIGARAATSRMSSTRIPARILSANADTTAAPRPNPWRAFCRRSGCGPTRILPG